MPDRSSDDDSGLDIPTGPSKALTIPGAPVIPGLHFRPYGGEDDVPAIVELYNAVNAANGNTEVWTVEEEKNELRNIPHIDPRQDFILGFVKDRLVASSSINYADTSDGQRLYRSRGWVHPDWRRKGIGGSLLSHDERRPYQVAAGHQHTKPPMLISWLDDGDGGGQALFAARGYEQVRVYHHMTRPHMDHIDVPSLPDGIETRPVKDDDLPRLWDALSEAFRDHFGSHDDTPEARRSWLDDPAMDPGLFAVAFDGDEVVAGVLGYVFPEENRLQAYRRGWADPVFTRRLWRRRGLARALLGRCLVLLRDAGMTSAQLDVDTQNTSDALTLYEEHGFSADRGSSEWHKPLNV